MSKTISEIYKEYKIFRDLQKHMLRVAAVAFLICENFDEKLDQENAVKACLLHDMGNIIKVDLNNFPEMWEPEGREYWQNVKEEYIEKYGEEHLATEKIAKELGISEGGFEILQNIGFSKSTKNETENIFENKICNYADMRAGPHGIMPLVDRVLESHKRYLGRHHDIGQVETFEPLLKSIKNVESQIFAKCSIKPEDITDEAIAPIIESLRNFVIK